MRQRADRDEIDSRLSDLPHGGKIDSAARLRFGAALHKLNGAPQFIGAHIIQQNEISACRERLLNLLDSISFNFDFKLRVLLVRTRYSRRNCARSSISERRQMIVLDQDHVEQTEAMILPAATSHGV